MQRYCVHYPAKQATITPRLLLTHLSGIRHYHGANGESPRTSAERAALDELRRREQSARYTRYTDVIAPLDAFKDDPLIDPPGTRFNYSSLGFFGLGANAHYGIGVFVGAIRTALRRSCS